MCQCEKAIYLPVINSGVFCYSAEGFYTGGSPGVVFGELQLLPCEQNLIFLLLSFDGRLHANQVHGQEETVEMS